MQVSIDVVRNPLIYSSVHFAQVDIHKKRASRRQKEKEKKEKEIVKEELPQEDSWV